MVPGFNTILVELWSHDILCLIDHVTSFLKELVAEGVLDDCIGVTDFSDDEVHEDDRHNEGGHGENEEEQSVLEAIQVGGGIKIVVINGGS